MKNLNKIVSIVLIMCCLFSCAVYAESNKDDGGDKDGHGNTNTDSKPVVVLEKIKNTNMYRVVYKIPARSISVGSKYEVMAWNVTLVEYDSAGNENILAHTKISDRWIFDTGDSVKDSTGRLE